MNDWEAEKMRANTRRFSVGLWRIDLGTIGPDFWVSGL